ncbi:bola-like protein [Microthyrium microscopicum]|uniref:Bola-like protein n=1 Tax=Microthyrium microscopicum TaxID=703497 RepID=A0A6A6UFN6_9PEZI|nr:bola-like protein [Microthyrium microscopicum]
MAETEPVPTSGVTEHTITTLLQKPATEGGLGEGTKVVKFGDDSGGCGQMLNATIVSESFQGKRSLARHKLVNSALKTDIAKIHAWTATCYTPEEWEKKQTASS